MPLRPYQQQAIDKIRKEYAAGFTRQLITLPTGAGKTNVFSSLPQELEDILPKQMLVLLHREELADQAVERLRQINPLLRIDKEMAKHVADPSLADVIVAGVGTLGRKGTKRLDKFNFENFDKVVVDEAHRSIAQSYYNVYNAVGLLEENDKRLLLGVTATPTRGDNQGLNQLYQKLSYTYTLRQAIEEKYLVDVRGLRISSKLSLDSISTSDGDFDASELANTVNTPERNQLILQAWLDNASNRITIGFTAGVKHAQDLAQLFRDNGIIAEAVWGGDPDRAEKTRKYRAGEIQVVFNDSLWVEGFDLDIISCVLLGGPTKSPVVYSQRVGRGTRLQQFKVDCLVIDFVDASNRHSLITLPTLMGLSKDLDMRGRSLLQSVREVEEAQALNPSIDFTKLLDISKLKDYTLEYVDLFEPKTLPEAESNSEFIWHNAATGGYVLSLPNRDKVTITQNLLDRWEVRGHLKGKTYKGERETIEEVFSAADKLVHDICPESLKVVKREAPWHNDPPTEKQLKKLARIYKGKQLPLDLTKGLASKLIGQAKAGKV